MEIEHRLTVVEERSESNERQIKELKNRQDNFDELVSTVKVLAVREQNVENDVKEIKNDVKSIKGEPADKWRTLINAILVAIAGGLVGYILFKLGL